MTLDDFLKTLTPQGTMHFLKEDMLSTEEISSKIDALSKAKILAVFSLIHNFDEFVMHGVVHKDMDAFIQYVVDTTFLDGKIQKINLGTIKMTKFECLDCGYKNVYTIAKQKCDMCGGKNVNNKILDDFLCDPDLE